MAVRQFWQHANSTEKPGSEHAFVCSEVINYIAGKRFLSNSAQLLRSRLFLEMLGPKN